MDLDVSREEDIKELLGNKGKHFLPCIGLHGSVTGNLYLCWIRVCVFGLTGSVVKEVGPVCISYFSISHTAVIEDSKIEECSACVDVSTFFTRE